MERRYRPQRVEQRIALEVQLEVRVRPRRVAAQQPNRPVLVAGRREPQARNAASCSVGRSVSVSAIA